MRRTAEPAGTMKHYRSFAGVVLGLALLAALAINPGETKKEKPVVFETAVQTMPATKPAKKAALASSAFGIDEGAPEDLGAEAVAGEQPAPTGGPGDPAAGADPAKAKPGDARPNPDQIDNLVAASRARSGGVDQGDEPRISS